MNALGRAMSGALVRTPRDWQVLFLTVAIMAIFSGLMATLAYVYLIEGHGQFEAPFQSGWGVVLVKLGMLLRDIQARSNGPSDHA